MTSPLSDVRVRLGACLLTLAVVAGVGGLTHRPGPAPSRAAQEQAGRAVVNRTALSCPVPGAGGQVRTVVNAVSPQLPDGTPTAGGSTTPLTIAGLSPTADPLGSLLVRGRLGSTAATTRLDALAVRGTGPLAAGTVATSTATASDGVNRGMASTPCQQPGSDFWFVGAGTVAGRRDVLMLTNLDTINAEVDVTMYGAAGVRDVPAARGIVVPARGTTAVYLNTVVPKVRDLALHVESSGGRVAASLRDNVTTGDTPGGVDWLSPSSAPATRVVVAALAPGSGLRSLSVLNPGELQATATITVNGSGGPFKPAGKATVDIPAGSVRTVRLDTALRGAGSGVTVSSDQPLTASARMADAKARDFASVGSAEPLTGPAYLVLPAHREPVVLQVTAPGKAASVRYELRDGSGKVVQEKSVDVVGGATGVVPFGPQSKPTYLTVTPSRGEVVAGVTLTPPARRADDIVRVAAWPLSTSLVFRAQLGVQPDDGAALR